MAPLRSMGVIDPGWEHGVSQDKKKKKVKCNYCGKIVSGGIFRLKQHLARISGDVTYCKKAPEEVYMKMKENLNGYRTSRKRRHEDEEQSFDQSNDDYEEDAEALGYKRKGNQYASDQNLVGIGPLRSLGFVDPGWEHGVAQDEQKKKVKCNYCEKVVSGGINRFKQHLARIPGEVAYCKMAPEEVYLKMKENMKWHRTGRRRRPETRELADFYMHSDNEEALADGIDKAKQLICEKDVSCSKNLKNKGFGAPSHCANHLDLELPQINFDPIFARTQKDHMPLPEKHSKPRVSTKKNHKEVIAAICKFFYYAAIPFTAADSTYFQKMLDLVGQYGQRLKAPLGREISGRFLQDEVVNLKEYQVEIRASWNATGCTIKADTRKDVQGQTVISFLVSCPRGIYFLSSIDATDIIEDVTNLYKLLDKIIEEVGEQNVVQVITENTACYKAAGKMLEEKRKPLFWTPCAAYCIDQMLEDFVKIKWAGECIQKGQQITKFIYNRNWLLNLMRKEFTAGRELLKPAATRFAITFATLQNLLEHRAAIRKLFRSRKWLSSQSCKSDEGKDVENIVLNSAFWKKMQYVSRSVQPLLHVLQNMSSDEGLVIASLYNDMQQAKIAIKAMHGDNKQKYGPFLSVIENHWSSLFQHPLYFAAYYFNPAYRYRPDFILFPEVMRGVNDSITRLELDSGRRVSAAMQISDFDFAKADFGTELALSTRMQLHPAAWWQQHGISCPELQRIAIRILSQTCSSFGCEHNWSSFDQICSTRHNYLAQKKLNDIAYVHYNLRLKERKLKGVVDDTMSLDIVSLEHLFEDWIVESDKHAPQEDEEILYNGTEQEYDKENVDFDTEPKDGQTDSGVMLPEIVGPSEAVPDTIDAASDEDDADLCFLEDDFGD